MVIGFQRRLKQGADKINHFHVKSSEICVFQRNVILVNQYDRALSRGLIKTSAQKL